jgi:cold shock CspA family protein
MATRYTGCLKKWNTERGFGFIVADDGGAELFVHISAFARNGPPPVVGEVLSFEVEPDRDGKKHAVRASRPGDQVGKPRAARHQPHHMSHGDEGSGFFIKLISAALVCAIAWYGYSVYSTRAAKFDSSLPALPAAFRSSKLPLPAGFRCDGRSMCSQMTSCTEATLFLQNCSGMQMDGNGDGVPCEQQWCTK